MTTSPKIESSDLSIEQMYKDFYIVPPYQREYVWSDVDVQDVSTTVSRLGYGEHAAVELADTGWGEGEAAGRTALGSVDL